MLLHDNEVMRGLGESEYKYLGVLEACKKE